MLWIQKNDATRAPRVTGFTRCKLVAGYKIKCPAGSFTPCDPYVSSIINSPPSYSPGSDRNSVAERSVRIRFPVPATCRIALSTCSPNDCPPEYRLNNGGNTRKGRAADKNSG